MTAAAVPRDRGMLLLRFDDRHFGSWERALPLFGCLLVTAAKAYAHLTM